MRRWGYTLHIKSRGEEAEERRSSPRYRARRWVVERSHSWMNRFRRLLIRWEKKAANYEAVLHLACAWITLQAAGVLGYSLKDSMPGNHESVTTARPGADGDDADVRKHRRIIVRWHWLIASILGDAPVVTLLRD